MRQQSNVHKWIDHTVNYRYRMLAEVKSITSTLATPLSVFWAKRLVNRLPSVSAGASGGHAGGLAPLEKIWPPAKGQRSRICLQYKQ